MPQQGYDVHVRRDELAPSCVVRFDSASHSSGVQRAYIRCPWNHHRCFKYKQVDQIPDRARLVAWLYCWALMGEGISKEMHRDMSVPSPDVVDQMMVQLAGSD